MLQCAFKKTLQLRIRVFFFRMIETAKSSRDILRGSLTPMSPTFLWKPTVISFFPATTPRLLHVLMSCPGDLPAALFRRSSQVTLCVLASTPLCRIETRCWVGGQRGDGLTWTEGVAGGESAPLTSPASLSASILLHQPALFSFFLFSVKTSFTFIKVPWKTL